MYDFHKLLLIHGELILNWMSKSLVSELVSNSVTRLKRSEEIANAIKRINLIESRTIPIDKQFFASFSS